MPSSLRIEIEKLTSVRTFWIALASGLAVTGLTLGTQLVNAGRAGTPSLDTARGAVAILGASGRASFVALVIGIVIVTSEFRHDTITTTFLTMPDRLAVVRAKVTAGATFGLLLAAVCLLLCLGVGLATGALTLAAGNTAVITTVLGITLGIPLFGVLGVGIGTLIPKQTVAITGALLWFLVGETMLGSYGLTAVQPYTPLGAVAAISADGSLAGALSPAAGFLLLLAYGVACATVGGLRLRSRDIT